MTQNKTNLLHYLFNGINFILSTFERARNEPRYAAMVIDFVDWCPVFILQSCSF